MTDILTQQYLNWLKQWFLRQGDNRQEFDEDRNYFEQGLVDFPSQFEGREIYLCWKLGEDRVRHWHEVDTGFEARQEIIEL